MTTTFYGIIPSDNADGFETRSYTDDDVDRIRALIDGIGVVEDDADSFLAEWVPDALDAREPGHAAHYLAKDAPERWAGVIEAFEALLDTTIADAKAWNDDDWTDEDWRHKAEVAWRRNDWPESWRRVEHLDCDSQTLLEAVGLGLIDEDDVEDWAADYGLGPDGELIVGDVS